MLDKPFKIGVFTSNKNMIEDIQKHAATDEELDICIATQGLDESLPVAEKMVREGVEIILGRRGTAHMLRETLRIPVLAFPQSDLNLILRLKEASALGGKILFPIFRNRIEYLDELFQLLHIDVIQMVYKDSASLEGIISRAYQQGVKVVVGGPHSVSIAKNYGLKVAEIQSSNETIITTIEDAKSVLRSSRMEHEISHKYQTIINSTSEGIIAVDKSGHISAINSRAQRYLALDEGKTIGKNISKLIKLPQIMRSIRERRVIKDNIEEIGDKSFVFTHIPIILGNDVVGGVSTFTDIGNLIKSENKVRKKLSKGLVANYVIDDLIHCSKEMKEIISRVIRFSKTNSTILINGETGTGKEILAQSIHNLSKRKNSPFVSINCAAIPENLLESELFGYEEGAFTGSRKGGKPGLFELAHTGSIFLDEISAASEAVQTRLLRVLQEREVMRIGSDQMIPIDVRVIAAANKDLARESRKGNFREDLYFRINVLKISLPPLRKRSDDIPLLINSFLEATAKEHLSPCLRIPNKYMKLLCSYPWPGNIRQVKNFAERLTLLCEQKFDEHIFHELFDELQEYFSDQNEERMKDPLPKKTEANLQEKIKIKREENESEVILTALRETRYNKIEAAKILDMSRGTLWRKMKKLGIDDHK